jgi:RNA polymerase sigma-70 factor (ECF subfamily)
VDSAEFDEFYRVTARRLVQYAYAICGDLGVAQDLAQEAYVRAWQRWRRLQDYEHTESWLRLVVTRLATDRWRRIGVRRRAHQVLRPPEPAPPPSEDSVLLTAALRRIPVGQRRVVTLHYLMDMSISDIAAETRTSVGSVKAQLSRGRASLAAALDGIAAQDNQHDPTPEGNHVR